MSTGLMERQRSSALSDWDQEDSVESAPDENNGWGNETRDVATKPRSALNFLSPLAVDARRHDRKQRVRNSGDRRTFEQLADELALATRGLSSTRLAYGHPAYAEIMALGEQSIPWLVERLETPGDRPIWLRMLGSLTQFQPGAGSQTIPEAAAAWIRWNKRQQAIQ